MGEFGEYLSTIAFEPSMLFQNVATVANILILFGNKKKGKKLAVEAFILFGILVVLNGSWEVVFGSAGSYFVTHILILLLYVIWCGDIRKRAYIITVVLFYAAEMAMIDISSIFPKVLEPHANGSVLEIIFRNMTVFLSMLVAVLFRKWEILKFKNISTVSTVYSVMISSATTLLAIVYYRNRENYNISGYKLALVAFTCILLINLVAYYLNYTICSYSEREKQLLIENASTQNYKEMLRLNQQNQEDMRVVRHDMKNHLAYIGTLLSGKQYEEAERYFELIQKNTLQQLMYIDCGNKNISAILNLETAKARSYGITLDYRIMTAPKLPVADDDMCALMTNLIDNAMEAVIRSKKEKAVIEVGINQKDTQLYICVINPIDESAEEKKLLSLKTTKQDKRLHGYGHRIVESIVQKYNGMMNRTVKNGKYIVDISLDLEEIP